MKRNERFLKTFFLALSATLIMKHETLDVRASDNEKAIFKEYHSDEEIEKEKIYRFEHQIEDDVELIDLSNKQLIKTICGDETKYYLCSEEYSYIKENVNQESIKELFQGTPSESCLNSKKSKYIKEPIIISTEYTDLTNTENKFIIRKESINVYNGFPSEKNDDLICWGDITTYCQTITGETYTEYKSFDVPTQKTSTYYDIEPETFIAICDTKKELKDIWEDEFITPEDLEYVVSSLNGDIPIYAKKIN